MCFLFLPMKKKTNDQWTVGTLSKYTGCVKRSTQSGTPGYPSLSLLSLFRSWISQLTFHQMQYQPSPLTLCPRNLSALPPGDPPMVSRSSAQDQGAGHRSRGRTQVKWTKGKEWMPAHSWFHDQKCGNEFQNISLFFLAHLHFKPLAWQCFWKG